MRRILYIALLLAVFLGSFFLALQLFDGDAEPPDATRTAPQAERLADKRVAGYDDLRRVAGDAGLRRSQRIKGNIDAITRIDDRQVSMVGWLADPEGDATPLKLLVFVGGAMAAMTETKGEREDVTHRLDLGFGSEKNVVFQVGFPCRTGEQPVVVGLGLGRQYFPLRANPCP